MKALKGYKVVSKNELCCIVVKKCVKYRFNEWVEPSKNCGPLCVFNTLEEARKFSKSIISEYYIYECLYYPSNEWVVYYPSNDHIYGFCKTSLFQLPKGTVLANRVKLIKKEKL